MGVGLPLWDVAKTAEPPLRTMHRSCDPETSIEAARRVRKRRLGLLHGKVLRAILRHGPMTDAELEALDVFAKLGPSTVRKRRSELYQDGRLTAVGTRKNERGQQMKVWELGYRARRSDEATKRRSDEEVEE